MSLLYACFAGSSVSIELISTLTGTLLPCCCPFTCGSLVLAVALVYPSLICSKQEDSMQLWMLQLKIFLQPEVFYLCLGMLTKRRNRHRLPRNHSQINSWLLLILTDCSPRLVRIYVWDNCQGGGPWEYCSLSAHFRSFPPSPRSGYWQLASMTSVSEFIGFLVIQILPTQTPKRTWKTRLTYRNKNTDHDSDGGEHSECDSSYEHNPVIERDPTSSEPTPGSHSTSASEPTLETAVMWKPDFWLVAFVMSMRTQTCHCAKLTKVSGCGLMYINVICLSSFG